MMRSRLSKVVGGFVAFALTMGASATVTNLAWYRGGEADPGAAAGVGLPAMGDLNPDFGTFQAVDSSGNGHNLVGGNSVVWSSDVPEASQLSLGASALSYGFTSSYLYRAMPAGTVTTLNNNVGLEAWVKAGTPDVGNAYVSIVHNGYNDGIGFLQHGSEYIGHIAGLDFVGHAPVSTTEWTHLAIVTVDGVTGFYVNGELNAAMNWSLPNVPTGVFLFGANVYNGSSFFNGKIDEVRMFSFNSGEFSAADLNYIPEPVTLGFLAVGGLLLFRRSRPNIL